MKAKILDVRKRKIIDPVSELAKKDTMIEYLAKKAWKHGFGESLPDAKYCRKLNDKACDYECWKCWIDEAYDKVVNHADSK